MTCAGSVRGAQSGQSTRPCQLQRGRETCQVRHQCGRRQWTSSCSFGRGSRDRVAEPSVGRMRRTRAARGRGRLGGHEECGQPLHEIVSHRSVPESKTGTYWKEWCAFPRSGSWADGPAGVSWLRSLCKTCESGVTGALRLQLGFTDGPLVQGGLNVVSVRGRAGRYTRCSRGREERMSNWVGGGAGDEEISWTLAENYANAEELPVQAIMRGLRRLMAQSVAVLRNAEMQW